MGLLNPGTYMSDGDKDRAKKRGTPVLLVFLAVVITLIGLSMGGDGWILTAFGAFCLVVAILAIKKQAAADAIAAKRAAEDEEIRQHRLRQARGDQ